MDEIVSQHSPSNMRSLKLRPLVSCDAERVISQCKTVLADNKSFLFDNLKMHLVIKCNENHILYPSDFVGSFSLIKLLQSMFCQSCMD